MAQGIRRPHEAIDFAAIERMYPLDPTLEDLFIGYARENVRPA